MSNQKRGEERMKEEDTLLKKLGKENSFKVPEGYFENLTSEVMNKLPEKEKSNFEGRTSQHMDKTETIALYGSYVYRCGSYYTGGIDRP